MRTTWRVLAAHRDLRLALSAGLISMSGDWILLIGLLYHVYAITGSTMASAFTMLSAGVPQVLLGPVAGVLADRWNRKKTMIYANLLLAIGLFPLLAVSGPGDVWIVYLVLVWEGAVQQFFSPAQRAMVPRLVADDRLPAANAINGQVGDIARLAGSALGGILAAVGGLATVTIADIASFFVSAILLAGIRTSGSVIREAATRTRLATVATDLRAGLRLVTTTRTLRGLMFFGLVTGLGEGIFATLVTPFVEHTLHGTSRQFGLFAAAQAIGGVAGGLLATSVSNRVSASRLLAFGAMAFGAVDLAIFLYPVVYVSLWPAVVGMIVAGLPSALAGAGMMTLLQRGVQDSFRGRLFGAFGAVQGLAVLIGTLVAGYLSGWLGTIPVIASQGGIWLLAGVGAVVLMRSTDSSPAPMPGDPQAVTL